MATLHGNWARGRLWVWQDAEGGGATRPVPYANPGALFDHPSAGVAFGADIAALSSLWRMAAETIAAKCVLPALEGRRSRWVPVLCATDRERVAAICAAAPQPCAAIPGAATPEQFFRDAVDLQMRASCATLRHLLFERVTPGNLHSSFLASLATPDGAVHGGDDADVVALSEALDAWRARAMPEQCGCPELGFRVADPNSRDSDNPLWRLVPVAVSEGRARPITRRLLDEIGPAAAHRLLLALGQASRLFHGLSDEESGDGGGRYAVATFDGAALRSFMESAMPRLLSASFPVFAPRWWKPAASRKPFIRAVSIERVRKEGAFSLDAIVNVKWEVVLDGTGVSPRELKWMAENDIPVARVGGKWMNLDPAMVKSAAATLASLAERPMNLRDLVRLGLGAGHDIDVQVPDSALPGEARRLVASVRHVGKVDPVPVPKGFAGKLRPYQRRGLDWLSFLRRAGFGACLADDMGLGKTVEALAAFLDARRDGVSGPFLVVCPMSIMLKWLHETRKFAPTLTAWIFHGPQRPRGEEFVREANSHDVCITSYQMPALEVESFGQVHWAAVALDEAQNIKNPETLKSRAARSLDSSWRLALTGTPVENRVTDIWAIMDFTNRGLLPARAEFERRFGGADARGDDAEATARLRRIVAPFVLRRVKSDPKIAAGLPAKVEEKVFCHLTVEQAALYAAETAAAEKNIAGRSGISRRGAVLALITRLKQICDYPSDGDVDGGASGVAALDAERSGKLATLDEMLRQVIDAGEAALVFTQYATFGNLLARHISEVFGFEVPFLHGGVTAGARAAMVKDFQDPSGPPVFLVSIRAGGLGFDLTRANHVFHYDRWWNPATESQATDRAHRIGQSKTVFVHTFICEGTLESKIDELIAGKRQLAGKVVADGAGWIAGLDDKQLMEVVSLSREMK